MNGGYKVPELIGLALLIAGAIFSNSVVAKMAAITKTDWEVGYKSRAADRRSREVIRKYRAKYGNDQLFRNLVIAYGLVGVGAVLMIVGRWLY